ncbi:uncharacterized protein TM35_000601090 [Trypanosoma theileri]|uniref:Uncharacterized protein n=1 Tax=Trypanosoma theileri TaxID=67003 RepID=A0A1X0NGN8_9TRYP|nr:uncharacterized protein TM35_000601090 [Trypanosoma theileri]ORC83678.1 hypothetical protein TM35_000601090 [Trypanosoma theileri]
MMSRVFCFLALLLSVVSLCVTAEAGSDPAAGGPCTEPPNDETCPPPGQTPPLPGAHPPDSDVGPRGDEACPEGGTGPQCKNNTNGPDNAPSGDCTKVTGKDNCVTIVDNTEGNCRDGSGPSCPTTRRTEQASQLEPGSTCPAADGATDAPCPSVASSSSGEGTHIHPQTKPSVQTLAPAETATPARSNAQEGPLPPSGEAAADASDSPGKGAGAGGAGSDAAASEGSDGAAPAGEPQSGESGRNENGAANTSSPPNSDTEGSSGSSAATVEHELTSAEGETTGTQEGNVGNTETSTTTTTTTTTLPPELTNSKKGDGDSSSSISSSVWVRVPLLIVVTLACILVC